MSQRLTKQDLEEIAKFRNHIILTENFEQIYTGVKTVIRFQCLTCNQDFETTVHSYKNAKKTGCPHCKKEIASKTHSGKVVSPLTRALIGQKASQRPGSLTGVTKEKHPRFKGGYARDPAKYSNADYEWLNNVKKLYGNKCALTRKTGKLHCHHLESWNSNPDLRYVITNGVCLHETKHQEFHKIYKYGNNTEDQFTEFCREKYSIDWPLLKASFGNHQPSLALGKAETKDLDCDV